MRGGAGCAHTAHGDCEGIAYLVENHTRNVTVNSAQIDPNRMFSRWSEASLKRLNPTWRPLASGPRSIC
jgi:hypothetical protein